MRGIPYSIDVLDLGNEAHLRPWPKNLRKRRKKQYLGVEKIKNDEEREPSRLEIPVRVCCLTKYSRRTVKYFPNLFFLCGAHGTHSWKVFA